MIVAVDLDYTLCIPNENGKNSEEKYGRALPIESNIEKVRKLYKDGNQVVIYTARRMLTHRGDVDKVKSDVGEITKSWLKKNHVPYHDVVFGKIYYDLIIDDKAINTENWK